MSSICSEAAGGPSDSVSSPQTTEHPASTHCTEGHVDDSSSGRGSPTKRSRRGSGLTAEQRAIVERNRQNALLIRQSKQATWSTNQVHQSETARSMLGSTTRVIDTGGGFLIEEPVEGSSQQPKDRCEPHVPLDPSEMPSCQDCGREFGYSYFWEKFEAAICDGCRSHEKHPLITRTEAKNEYLLKDCDFDLREPPLRYIVKKNPHPHAKGDMRLYLRPQVEERALEVWGSEEELERQRDLRNEKRYARKEKAHKEQIKKLRKEARSSLFVKKQIESHEHVYGEEKYLEETYEYEKKCLTCGYVLKFEKM